MEKDKVFYKVKCITCGSEFDEKKASTSCLKCGDPLEIEYDFEKIKSRLNMYTLKNAPIAHAKYFSLMPVLNLSNIISLNEGGTPLLKSRNLANEFGIKELYIKNEGANPTGVFKDRGTSIEITKAMEIGAKAICVASTGNMAASVAAYAAIAKMPCYVLIPDGTPIGKLSQTLAFGARVLQIRSDYSVCIKLSQQMSEKYNFYLAGDYVFRGEGAKTLAFEIVEQLLWKVPDYVICPMGCGTNIAAIWKGFLEFKQLGLIDKLPKLIGVQTENCQVIVKAYKKKTLTFIPEAKIETSCSGIAIGSPLDGKKALKALYDSKGFGIAVKDQEALDALKSLSKEESIFVEPAGALSIAAVRELSKRRFFKKDDIVVVIATGTGLKDSASILKTILNPPACEPNMNDIDNFIRNKLWEIQPKGKTFEKPLWNKIPSPAELAKTIKKEFDVTMKKEFLKFVIEEITAFKEKGKLISKSNLKSILEEEVKQFTLKKEVLKIMDYSASSYLHDKAKANIKFKFKNKIFESSGSGVGAFDAIIVAFKKVMKQINGIDVSIADFNVEIDSGGADAVVKVTMILQSGKEKVNATTASPDVITAAVKAFEKGFNILYNKLD